MNQTRKHGRSARLMPSAPRSAANSQTRPMSTEEYLRTEVFGDQNRMQQKRMANLAQLERRAEDTPISMEEYVRHIVYAQDLPDAAACHTCRDASSHACSCSPRGRSVCHARHRPQRFRYGLAGHCGAE